MNITKKVVLNTYAAHELISSNRLIVLERDMETHDRTTGQLLVNNKVYPTIELPWRYNQRNISCIPKGVYTWQKITRQSNGKNAIYIRDVENRSQILIHYGTKPEHSEGCILTEDFNELYNQLQSKGIIVIL